MNDIYDGMTAQQINQLMDDLSKNVNTYIGQTYGIPEKMYNIQLNAFQAKVLVVAIDSLGTAILDDDALSGDPQEGSYKIAILQIKSILQRLGL